MISSETMMPQVRRICVAACIQLQTTAMRQQVCKIERVAEILINLECRPLVALHQIPIKFLSSWPKRSMVDKKLAIQLGTWQKVGNTYAEKLNMRALIDDKRKSKQFK